MCDFVGPILEVIKFVGRPAKKYLNYHRKFKDYEEGFKQAKKDLQVREGDIRLQLHDEHRFGKKPRPEVERWFEKVEEKFDHARDVEDKVSKGKFLFRSCLGKLVDEKTQEIEKVRAEGHFSGSLVVDDPSAATPMPVPELVGGYNAKEKIYKYLEGDEVTMIGVWGMGGIGKTTIMKHVYNRLFEENKFRIWTTVSQNFDIRKLQESIANQLKEKFDDDDDLAIRAAKLSGMLRRQGRYVLILDDVWSSFSLEEVGIPKPTADNGCKLVLTTRSEEVVRSMDCTGVPVSRLLRKEPLQLFLSTVGQAMVVPNPTLESIVAECDGLPLAIVIVAACMKSKGTSDPVVWENALNELRGHIRTLQDVEDKVFACLKFSYNRLRQIDQDCFLYCALYPEDHEIPKEQIIENWMDEGLVEAMGTRRAMQSNGHSILKKLEENCLLERVGDEGTCIKMHAVVRDMALHITRKRFLVKAGNKKLPSEEEWTEDLEKISLMHNWISTIPPEVKFPKFEKLTTLLFRYNGLENIPESFFNHMPNLKVLDLSNEDITIFPKSILNLEKLTALSFHGCKKLHYIPSLLKLQALKKLDLGDTSIKEIPLGLEMLVNLRYLNLGYSRDLEEIPNGLLSKLCHLQYLAIHPASTRAKEMRELNELEVFEGHFSNVPDFINFAGQRKKLHRYWIWVSQYGGYDSYRIRKDYRKWVQLDKIGLTMIGDGIMLACDIQQLQLRDCVVRSLNDISGWEDLTDLKECLVWLCYEVESIFPSMCRQLETLECLDLRFLDDLKGIVGVSSVITFSSLKIIILYDCGTIKNLFSAKWVMPNLERINVLHCEKMEEIIVSEEAETIKFQYVLPKLRKLVLRDLPKLKNICNENGVMVCDSLQKLKIERCEKLKRIPLYLGPDKEEPSLPPLNKIQVDSEEWWESAEFDHPLAKNVLQPILYFYDHNTRGWKPAV